MRIGKIILGEMEMIIKPKKIIKKVKLKVKVKTKINCAQNQN